MWLEVGGGRGWGWGWGGGRGWGICHIQDFKQIFIDP